MAHPYLDALARSGRTLHIAHRGGGRLSPENTFAAFDLAVGRYATDMIELDVALTSDDVVVVAHDLTVDRCTNGTGPVAEYSFEALSTLDAGYEFTADDGETFPFRARGVRIPMLEEVLRRYPPPLLFNVELKSREPALIERVVDILRRTDSVHRVCCGSEDDEVAARLYDAIPEACHFMPRGSLTAFVLAALQGNDPPDDRRWRVLDMPIEYEGVRIFQPRFADLVWSTGRWVNVWTIDDPDEMRRLCDAGVGGIMTDRPDLLREVLDSRFSG